jgi:fatty-acid desaturase
MKKNLSIKEFIKVSLKYSSLWGGLIPLHTFGLYAAYEVYAGYFNTINWLYLGVGYFCIMLLGITAGFHRLFSHKSYTTYNPIRYLLLFFGLLAGQGSPIFWIVTHRNLHHPNSDTDKDPHSPQHGLATSWFLWLWKIEEKDINPKHAVDLFRDPVLLWIHRYYIYIYWALNLIFAVLSIGVYWFTVATFGITSIDIWIWGVIVPALITFHSYSITNCLNHISSFGYKNYLTRDNSVNVPWLWPLVLGECWHNNHHGDVKASHFGGVNWWELDPAGLIIKVIKKHD